MNKRIIMVIGGLLLVFLVICFSLFKRDDEQIPKYDADIICRSANLDNDVGSELNSRSNIYIYENNGYIDKMINQVITNDLSYDWFFSELVDLYNQIEGITATVDIIQDKLVVEITYDYKTLDLKVFRSTVGHLLSEDSVYYNIEDFPISVEEYKKRELKNYECEVK